MYPRLKTTKKTTNVANFENFRKLWTAVYSSNMAPIGLKLCQNAFQTIPDISFFNAGHKFVFAFFANFEDPFTPRGWLRLAWNFGKTRFRRSPTFHFSTPKKKFSTKNFVKNIFATPPRKSVKCLFWRSCEFLDVSGRSASKNHCQTYRFQPFTTLGGGVKKAVCVFFVSLGKKKLAPSLLWNRTLMYVNVR